MDFDPDAYLASPAQGQAPPAFDPDAYLASPKAGAQTPFDPDAYLSSQPDSSAGGTFVRSAAQGAIPSAAGFAAAIPAAAAGAAAGTAVFPGVGTLVGGIAAGGAAALGAGYLASKGQDWVLDKLGLRDHLGLDPAQRQADAEQHPIAEFAGEGLDALIGMRPTAGLALKARAGGAAIMGGLEAGQEYANNGSVDPTKVAASAGLGALLPEGAEWTKRAIPQPKVRTPNDPVKSNIGGATPTPEADSPDIEIANDITTTSRGVAAENPPAPEVVGAGNPTGAPMLAREAAGPSDPERDYRKTGQGATSADKVETASSTTGVTLSDNPVKDDVAAALNPTHPSSPSGMFEDENGQWQPAPESGLYNQPQAPGQQEQLPIETGLAGTRTEAQPQPVPAQAEPGSTASPGGNVFAGHNQAMLDQTVQKAAQAAMTRPIVEQPMPSIANSSRNMRGPVVVDPTVPPEYRRPLAVHETVEQTLMAQGMGYKDAHNRATKAEEQAVQAAGIDLTAYRDWFDKNQKHIEAQNVNPQSYANLDLHVDPEAAISHYANSVGPDGTLHADHPDAGDFGAAPKVAAQEPVTAAVSDADKMNINAIRAQLLHPDLKGALDKFDALSPEEQAQAAKRGIEAHGAEQTAAKEAGYRYKLETGVQAGGGARAQRKSGALAAIKEAVTKFASDQEYPIPTSKADKAKLISRLTDMVAHAKEKFGSDPLNRTTGYQPRVKPPEWQLLKAASRAVEKPTPANIKAYVAAEKMLSTGDAAADAAAAKDLQDTDRIDADKNLRRLPTDTHSQEAMIAAAKEGEQAARVDFPPFDNTSGDECKVYEGQQNKLRDWLNGLDDVDYRLIANRHPDLARNIETVQDPAKLHTILEGDLEGLQEHSPGKITLVDPEEAGTPAREIPVASAEAIKRLEPTEPGADAGKRVLSDEEKAKIAEQMGLPVAKKPGLTAEKRRAMNEAARAKAGVLPDRATEEAAASTANTNERVIPPEAINGSWGALADKAKQFGADEAGGGGGQNMSWLTGKYHDFWDPKATPPEREYGEALDDRLHVLGQKHMRDDVYLRANAMQTGDYTPREWQEANRALEKGDRTALPDKMQEDLKEHYDPVKAKLDEALTEYKELRPDLNLPDLTENYVPRMRKGTESDPTEDKTDVLLNVRRGLSGEASALKAREFFEAVTPGGLRTVFQPEPGGIRIYVGGKSKHYDVDDLGTENKDPNYVGKQFTLGKQQYTVDHAWTNNLNTHVRDADGKPLEYLESPILTVSNAYKGVKTALDNWKMVNSIVGSKEFEQFATRDSAEGREKGYEEITLPDKAFRGMWAAKPIARVLNDFSKPGFAFDDTGLMRQANRALTKMIFSTPFPHALNETALWATQRGFDWINPAGYGRLLRTATRAMKSVNGQDYIQDQLAQHGASPMLGGVLTRQNMAQIAEKMGLEVQRDAPKYDPMFKALGVRSSDLVNYWYKNVAQKPMWWWSDFLLTQQFLEHQEKGASLGLAAKKSHEFISDYRVPTAALPGVLPDRAGRLMSQAMADSSWLMFGRYRYGLAKSAVNMAKNLVSPNASHAERVQALGNVMAMAALSYGVWPLANAAIQKVTGNPKAELDPAGMLREVRAVRDNFGPDATKDVSSIIRGIAQPAPIIQAGTDLIGNKDWKGDPIVVRGDTFTRRGAAQIGSFAANQVAPVNTAQQAYETAQGEGSGAAGAAGRVLASQLGVHLPSPKAQKYEATIRAKNAAAEKAHQRKASPIEKGINFLTGG